MMQRLPEPEFNKRTSAQNVDGNQLWALAGEPHLDWCTSQLVPPVPQTALNRHAHVAVSLLWYVRSLVVVLYSENDELWLTGSALI